MLSDVDVLILDLLSKSVVYILCMLFLLTLVQLCVYDIVDILFHMVQFFVNFVRGGTFCVYDVVLDTLYEPR
jgi:hypothetical protein